MDQDPADRASGEGESGPSPGEIDSLAERVLAATGAEPTSATAAEAHDAHAWPTAPRPDAFMAAGSGESARKAAEARPTRGTETRGRSAFTRDWRFPAVFAVAAVLGVGVVATGYLSVTNKHRADRWQMRSATLERNVSELNSVLVVRSNTLNARTRELNRMAVKVKKQKSALSSSEADVASLARRQRALADEKAKIEDSRAQLEVQTAALENVASAIATCNGGLSNLLGYVLDDDYASANAIAGRVVSDCQYANSSLSDYNSSYS